MTAPTHTVRWTEDRRMVIGESHAGVPVKRETKEVVCATRDEAEALADSVWLHWATTNCEIVSR